VNAQAERRVTCDRTSVAGTGPAVTVTGATDCGMETVAAVTCFFTVATATGADDTGTPALGFPLPTAAPAWPPGAAADGAAAPLPPFDTCTIKLMSYTGLFSSALVLFWLAEDFLCRCLDWPSQRRCTCDTERDKVIQRVSIAAQARPASVTGEAIRVFSSYTYWLALVCVYMRRSLSPTLIARPTCGAHDREENQRERARSSQDTTM